MDFDTRYEQWTLLVIGIKKNPSCVLPVKRCRLSCICIYSLYFGFKLIEGAMTGQLCVLLLFCIQIYSIRVNPQVCWLFGYGLGILCRMDGNPYSQPLNLFQRVISVFQLTIPIHLRVSEANFSGDRDLKIPENLCVLTVSRSDLPGDFGASDYQKDIYIFIYIYMWLCK